MESEDEHTHRPFTTLSWQALLIVRRLKNQPPRKGSDAEAPELVREGGSTATKQPSAPGEVKRREAVKLDRLASSPAQAGKRVAPHIVDAGEEAQTFK